VYTHPARTENDTWQQYRYEHLLHLPPFPSTPPELESDRESYRGIAFFHPPTEAQTQSRVFLFGWILVRCVVLLQVGLPKSMVKRIMKLGEETRHIIYIYIERESLPLPMDVVVGVVGVPYYCCIPL